MACVKLLVVVAALAAVVTQAAAYYTRECGGVYTVRCSNNRCILPAWVCDGANDCSDGSDEAACEGPNATLAVGESIAVRASVTSEHGYMYALACNATECGRLKIGRYSSDDTRLAFTPSTGCGWPQWKHCRHEGYADGETLSPGTYQLVLQRRDSELAVWHASRPDNVGLVDAPDGGFTVRLRADWNNKNFNVEFGEPSLNAVLPLAADGGEAQSTAAATEGTPAATTTAPTSAPCATAASPASDYPEQPLVKPLSWWRRRLGADSSSVTAPADEKPSLRGALADMSLSLAALRADVSALRGEGSVLRADVSALRGEGSVLRADVSALGAEGPVVRGEVSALRAEVSSQRGALADLGESMAALRADFRAFASWAEQLAQGQQQQQRQQRLADEGAPRF